MITVVALVAGALTTGAWLPQIWRTWRTRSAEDLSWGYLFVTACGMGTWLTYGLLAEDPAVIATNTATSILLVALCTLKLRSAKLGDLDPSLRSLRR